MNLMHTGATLSSGKHGICVLEIFKTVYAAPYRFKVLVLFNNGADICRLCVLHTKL